MELLTQSGEMAHYAHYMVGRGAEGILSQWLDTTRYSVSNSLRERPEELGDSQRWYGQADDGFAGIRLWKLWRHPGKGRRGTCRNRRYHPTAN